MRLFEISDEGTQMVRGILPEVGKNCSEFLKSSISVRRYLWRQTRKHGGPFYVGASRPGDRRPTDMDRGVQGRIDEFLQYKGFKALRRNSTFTWSGGIINKPLTMTGNSFMIFPKNGFAFSWADKFTDLYEYVSELLHIAKSQPDKEFSAMIEDVLNTPVSPNLLMTEFDQLFSYHNTNMEEALNNASEIMISGEYYAIHSTFVEEVTSYFFKDNKNGTDL